MKELIFCFGIFTLLCSCGSTEQDPQLQILKQENEALKAGTSEKDTTIKRFIGSFNQIINNLNYITETQKKISNKAKSVKKFKADDKALIQQYMDTINSRIEENKTIAATMKANFSSAKVSFSEFDTMLKNMQCQIEAKDSEISTLKQSLGDADVAYNTFDFTLEQLTTVNIEMEKKVKELQSTVDKQQAVINTGYYIFGSYKELRDAGVVAKTTLAKVESPSKDFSTKKFIRADIRELKSLDVWTPNFRLISCHPAGSFKTDRNKLLITNPDEFWKLTRYLVVLKE